MHTKRWLKDIKRGVHLGNLCNIGTVILEWMLAGLRYGLTVGFCKHGNKSSGAIKVGNFFTCWCYDAMPLNYRTLTTTLHIPTDILLLPVHLFLTFLMSLASLELTNIMISWNKMHAIMDMSKIPAKEEHHIVLDRAHN